MEVTVSGHYQKSDNRGWVRLTRRNTFFQVSEPVEDCGELVIVGFKSAHHPFQVGRQLQYNVNKLSINSDGAKLVEIQLVREELGQKAMKA